MSNSVDAAPAMKYGELGEEARFSFFCQADKDVRIFIGDEISSLKPPTSLKDRCRII